MYPAPNCCWQIDATEWSLADGRKVVIFQLIDDHSRLALASLAANSENSTAAIHVVKTAISRHGVPQRLLSDNGTALNPTRRGVRGALVTYLKSLGVVPITGKPYKPTTQGKNERFHRTLLQYLNARPAAGSLIELQTQLDAFDKYYNTERDHQALPPGTTPKEAWDATPSAPPPTPPAPRGPDIIERIVTARGIVSVLHADYVIGTAHAGRRVNIIHDQDTVSFFDDHGTEIINYPRPADGTRYVGPHTNRRPPTSPPSTKS